MILTSLFSQINKPINGADHDRPADNIADRYREQVPEEKIVPGQPGKI
jgi:hypothetical protein